MPYLKAMVSPIWAAAADAPHGAVGLQRVMHALRWLEAFLARRRGVLVRKYRPDDEYAEGQIVIDVDASPWGFGGVLYARGEPLFYFGEAVSEHDVNAFNITIGDAKDQALLEFLALLIAVRLWKDFLCRQRWTVTVRTHSTAALGAACKLRSPEPRMNRIARELALDLAEAKYELDFLVHIPGLDNDIADALSRLFQPEGGGAVPTAFGRARCMHPAVRSNAWWETAGGPAEGDHTADLSVDGELGVATDKEVLDLMNEDALNSNSEECSEVFLGVKVITGIVVAGEPWDLLRGGREHDVTQPGPHARLKGQMRRSSIVWWAPECCTFSRARGKPVPGAKHWPLALLSQQHLYGLPSLGIIGFPPPQLGFPLPNWVSPPTSPSTRARRRPPEAPEAPLGFPGPFPRE